MVLERYERRFSDRGAREERGWERGRSLFAVLDVSTPRASGTNGIDDARSAAEPTRARRR